MEQHPQLLSRRATLLTREVASWSCPRPTPTTVTHSVPAPNTLTNTDTNTDSNTDKNTNANTDTKIPIQIQAQMQIQIQMKIQMQILFLQANNKCPHLSKLLRHLNGRSRERVCKGSHPHKKRYKAMDTFCTPLSPQPYI